MSLEVTKNEKGRIKNERTKEIRSNQRTSRPTKEIKTEL